VSKPLTIDRLISNFEMFSDWEERYRYLIDLGRKLPEMPPEDKSDANKVEGCISQVWLTCARDAGQPPTLTFQGDSDAHIVKGLVALMARLYSNRTPAEALTIDPLRQRLALSSTIAPRCFPPTLSIWATPPCSARCCWAASSTCWRKTPAAIPTP